MYMRVEHSIVNYSSHHFFHSKLALQCLNDLGLGAFSASLSLFWDFLLESPFRNDFQDSAFL